MSEIADDFQTSEAEIISISRNFAKQLSRGGAKGDKVEITALNLLTLLRKDPSMEGVFGWNEWSDSYMVLRRPPWESYEDVYPRPFDDHDNVALRAYFEGLPQVTASFPKALTTECVGVTCRAHKYNPLMDLLNGLQWDGVERLDTWAIKYLKALDRPINRVICRKWLISAMARALKPGCQADYMLIMEGEQDIGKTSCLRILFGEFLQEDLPDPKATYAGLEIQGAWVIESSEMAHLSRTDSSAMKAFITKIKDTYKLPYDKFMTVRHRHCVFCATTNITQYLKDPTGERRYWPITLGATGEFDLQGLREARAQILAEAKACFLRGDAWHPTKEESAEIRKKHGQRSVEDSTYDALEAWTSVGGGRELFTFTEAMVGGLGQEEAKIHTNSTIGRKTSEALERLGYVRRQITNDNWRKRVYIKKGGAYWSQVEGL